MQLVKIFEGRIDTLAQGAEAILKLRPRAGGRMCKVVHYDVKVSASSRANVRIGLDLLHSPDGTAASFHSAPIINGSPGTALPNLLSGDADTVKIVGEWLHVELKIKDSAVPVATAQWALVEVYELRQPF